MPAAEPSAAAASHPPAAPGPAAGPASTAELLLHPVRLRVVQAFLGDRELTTGQLRAELPDVSPATLYRQVAVLVAADVLVVASERRVRGAVERCYRLRAERAAVSAEEAAAMTPEEHRAAFTTFVATLLADFDRWVEGVQPRRDDGGSGRPDLIGYRQAALWATDEELLEVAARLRAVVAPHTDAPAPGRTRRLLSTVLLPAP